jgi:hypothetical protein
VKAYLPKCPSSRNRERRIRNHIRPKCSTHLIAAGPELPHTAVGVIGVGGPANNVRHAVDDLQVMGALENRRFSKIIFFWLASAHLRVAVSGSVLSAGLGRG